VRKPKKTAGMGAARAWKHRFFCPFLVTSFGQAKEVKKKKSTCSLDFLVLFGQAKRTSKKFPKIPTASPFLSPL